MRYLRLPVLFRLATVALALCPAVVATSFLPAPAQQKQPEVKKAPQKAGLDNRGTGYRPLTPAKRAYYQAVSLAKHGDRITMAARNLALPTKYDERDKVPLPMGDQGQCGSCYGYSTVWFTLTSAGVRAGLGKSDGSYRLSVQWMMDRPRNFGGCDGGNGTEVVDYVCKNGMPAEKWVDLQGVLHSDYPAYEARSGSDRTATGAKVWCKGWDWGFVNANGNPTTDEIKAAMLLHGRLNVALDAGGQFGNGTGTITVLGRNINHEINVVAWDDNHDNGDGTKGALLAENQWSELWGIKGYRWITYVAARQLVDIFWVSAGAVPPPPEPPAPPVPGKAVLPYLLYQGKSGAWTKVGQPAGYNTLAPAEGDALTIANTSQLPVYVYDSTTPIGMLIETVQPGAPVPPGPVGRDVVITLRADGTYTMSGGFVVNGDMTLQQIVDQLRKSQQKESK